MTKRKRSPDGECLIVVRSNRLRLRVPKSIHPSGKQTEIALDMADSEAGRTVAAQILADVQLDIYNGKLDPTLDKYRRKQIAKAMTVYDLWCAYLEYKQPTIKASTLYYYQVIGKKLQACPRSIDKAIGIRAWLIETISPNYAAKILTHLNSAVDWGMRHDLISLDKNPYIYMGQEISKTNRVRSFPVSSRLSLV
jgi:hypothetical protein